MVDQYAVLLAMAGSFFIGLMFPTLWRLLFKDGDVGKAKERIYEFVVSMDERYPDLSGAEKKERVLNLVKAYVPGVSEELASILIDFTVGLWRFETEDIPPRERQSKKLA